MKIGGIMTLFYYYFLQFSDLDVGGGERLPYPLEKQFGRHLILLEGQ